MVAPPLSMRRQANGRLIYGEAVGLEFFNVLGAACVLFSCAGVTIGFV